MTTRDMATLLHTNTHVSRADAHCGMDLMSQTASSKSCRATCSSMVKESDWLSFCFSCDMLLNNQALDLPSNAHCSPSLAQLVGIEVRPACQKSGLHGRQTGSSWQQHWPRHQPLACAGCCAPPCAPPKPS